MYFTNYAYELIKDIPSDVFEGLTGIICIGMVTFIAWKGWKTEEQGDGYLFRRKTKSVIINS